MILLALRLNVHMFTQLYNGNVIDLLLLALDNKSQTGLSHRTSSHYCSDLLSLLLVESNRPNSVEEILAKLLQFN